MLSNFLILPIGLVKVCVYFTVDHLSHFCPMTLRMNCDCISALRSTDVLLNAFVWILFGCSYFQHSFPPSPPLTWPLFALLCSSSLSLFPLSRYALQADVRWILIESEGQSGERKCSESKKADKHAPHVYSFSPQRNNNTSAFKQIKTRRSACSLQARYWVLVLRKTSSGQVRRK